MKNWARNVSNHSPIKNFNVDISPGEKSGKESPILLEIKTFTKKYVF